MAKLNSEELRDLERIEESGETLYVDRARRRVYDRLGWELPINETDNVFSILRQRRVAEYRDGAHAFD